MRVRIKDLTYQWQIKCGDDEFIKAYIGAERGRGRERESERELSS